MHATIGDHLADLVHNAIEADATKVELRLQTGNGSIAAEVRDNGKGMSPEETRQACSPFFSSPSKHLGRKVGLGLSFLKQTVQTVGGSMDLESRPRQGTRVRFSLPESHIDTPPMGDLPDLFVTLLASRPGCSVTLWRETPRGEYQIDTERLFPCPNDLFRPSALSRARTLLNTHEEAIR